VEIKEKKGSFKTMFFFFLQKNIALMNTLEATHIAQKQAHVFNLIKLLNALFSQNMS